jgi:hypothetical protein
MLAEKPLTLKGELELLLRGSDGRIKARRKTKNIITTVGRNSIVDNLLASPTLGNLAAGTATGALQEAGIWDALTAGTLWARGTYTTINKGASDTLQVTWTWTIG